ncbi:ankyrin repeat-containing domain protein, partial [Mycena epipterygia]
LQAAAFQGNLEIVKLLLAHGANPNIEGGQNGTALQAATVCGHTDIVKVLLEHGADASVQG